MRVPRPWRLRLAALALALGAAGGLAGCSDLGPVGPAEVSDPTAAAEPTETPTPPPAPDPDPAPAPTVDARPGQVVRTTLRDAVAALPVRPEHAGGYDRDLFPHWDDADGNGCDTRREVLITQNRAPGATLGAGCTVLAGEWFSYYDQETTGHAADFDVDHLVPLAEAWSSGAHAWDPARRRAFANDLGERRALIAVSASSNRSKSAADPAEWMPAYQSCVYVSSWVAVKTRWQLSVDETERAALAEYAERCGARRTTVRIAAVTPTGSTADARPSDAASLPPAPAPAPTRVPSPPPAPPAAGGTDPRFDFCYSVLDAGYGPYVRGQDPEYSWYRDNDGDGVVCES
ncbi:GmrSD restriction endonuclease domain-containing protein [Nocardioides pantholopis]|uniref:GmrSD restriction endonuclease domain-containing protein n=1 Tax=Nocardioides pantholopis TaxID=2483798 RepID=UPI000FDACB79|nr:DUF1524 domain-containing protein [Nocardioides pantholopis]